MPHTLLGQLSAGLWVAVCLFALWKGDQTERLAGAFLLIAWLVSLSVWTRLGLTHPVFTVFAVDVVAVLVLGFLGWKSTHSWPIWATAFQAIQATTHIAFAMDLKIGAWAYFAATWIASKGVILSLAIGTWLAWREREALKPIAGLGPNFKI